MTTPILQPILQEDEQIQKILYAAGLYGSASLKENSRPVLHGALDGSEGHVAETDRLNLFERGWRKFGAAVEIARPFSFTASAIPVLAAGALALVEKQFNFSLFISSLAASVLLHIGTNITNEIYDVRNGVDSITSPRASQSLLKGRITEREAFNLIAGSFLMAMLLGVALIAARGWQVALLGLLGLALGYGYTAPPFQYKYRALGLPLVFILMGPLMVVGAYYVITGSVSLSPVIVSVPIGFLVTAILHGNEWRDISDDARFGIGTLSAFIGRKWAHLVYVSLVTGAYLAVVLGVLAQLLPQTSLLALLSMPLLVRSIHTAGMGANGIQRSIAKIDLETAQLHAAFGVLFVIGLALGKMI
jgi:1,4-dihydroxy-2-naphthoate octaprenyltransferase